jgi:ABC-type glycerol-3-phosphate transport system substrate-binding protein
MKAKTQIPLSRRQFLVRGSYLLSASMLAACGAQAPGQGFQSAPTAGSAAANATVAPTTASGQGTVNTDLRGQLIVSISSDVPEEAYTKLISAYRERRPNVELLWEYSSAAEENYDTWLSTQLAAGDIRPDIVSPNYTYRGFVNFDKYRTTINPHTGNPFEQDYDYQLMQLNPFAEGIVMATRAVHVNWFYNKELFAKAGVEPPTTWAEFVEVCSKLEAAGITPIASNYIWMLPQWISSTYFDQYHVNWVEQVRAQKGDWSYNPALDDAFVYDPTNPHIHRSYSFNAQRFWKGIRDGELRFDTPEFAEMTRNLAAIFPQYAIDDLFVIEDPYLPFLQQQAAIMSNGSWMPNILNQDMEALNPERLEELELPADTNVRAFEWGTFENPPMEGPLVKSPVRAVESAAGEYIGIIDKNQQQTDLALDFVMFWLSAPGYQAFFDGRVEAEDLNASGPLAVRGVQEPPALQETFAAMPILGNAENQYNFMPFYLGEGDLITDARNLFKEALEGKITPEDYGTQLQEYVTTNFERIITSNGLTMADIDNPARQPGT